MIKVSALSKTYGQIVALDRISFRVGEGEIFGLLGPNGAGKTTTLRVLTLLSRPDGGTARVAGFDIGDNPRAIKKRIGVVPQENNLERELSVRDNLELYGMLHNVDDLSGRIEGALRNTGLWERRDLPVQTLSGGMQRRLLIARALLPGPHILFLDEPTVGLDPQIRREIWDEIRGIRHRGATILLTTHYIEEAELLCDRVGILSRGHMAALDTPAALKERVGRFILEITLPDGKTERQVCADEAEARAKAAAATGEAVTIRRANLEDVFVELTGERMEP
jgi:ABC-2 type transport system ATP-binding protein